MTQTKNTTHVKQPNPKALRELLDRYLWFMTKKELEQDQSITESHPASHYKTVKSKLNERSSMKNFLKDIRSGALPAKEIPSFIFFLLRKVIGK